MAKKKAVIVFRSNQSQALQVNVLDENLKHVGSFEVLRGLTAEVGTKIGGVDVLSSREVQRYIQKGWLSVVSAPVETGKKDAKVSVAGGAKETDGTDSAGTGSVSKPASPPVRARGVRAQK